MNCANVHFSYVVLIVCDTFHGSAKIQITTEAGYVNMILRVLVVYIKLFVQKEFDIFCRMTPDPNLWQLSATSLHFILLKSMHSSVLQWKSLEARIVGKSLLPCAKTRILWPLTGRAEKDTLTQSVAWMVRANMTIVLPIWYISNLLDENPGFVCILKMPSG